MKLCWSVMIGMSLVLTTVDATPAKKSRAGARAPASSQRAPSFEAPRMIEVRPGVIISTYDCIIDIGMNRWRPCGGTR